jgi:hypothetical protein
VCAGLYLSFYGLGRISARVTASLRSFWQMAGYITNTVQDNTRQHLAHRARLSPRFIPFLGSPMVHRVVVSICVYMVVQLIFFISGLIMAEKALVSSSVTARVRHHHNTRPLP